MSKLKKAVLIIGAVLAPATFSILITLMANVANELKRGSPAIFIIKLVVMLTLFSIGLIKLLRRSPQTGIPFLLAAIFMAASFGNDASEKIEVASAKLLIAKNDQIERIAHREEIYYFDELKEQRALFYDKEMAFNTKEPNDEWINRHPIFKSCPFRLNKLKENLYLVHFGC